MALILEVHGVNITGSICCQAQSVDSFWQKKSTVSTCKYTLCQRVTLGNFNRTAKNSRVKGPPELEHLSWTKMALTTLLQVVEQRTHAAFSTTLLPGMFLLLLLLLLLLMMMFSS